MPDPIGKTRRPACRPFGPGQPPERGQRTGRPEYEPDVRPGRDCRPAPESKRILNNECHEKNRSMKLFDVYPINEITIVKAKGSYVWDQEGQQYLDCYGGHSAISIGHTAPPHGERNTQ